MFALIAFHVNENKQTSIVDLSSVITNANILMLESHEQITSKLWRAALLKILNEKISTARFIKQT